MILTGSMIFIPIILSKYAFISHMHFIVFSLGITVIYILYAPCGGKYSNVKGLALLWIKTVVTLILFAALLNQGNKVTPSMASVLNRYRNE